MYFVHLDKTQQVFFSLRNIDTHFKNDDFAKSVVLWAFIGNDLRLTSHIDYPSTRPSTVIYLLNGLIDNIHKYYLWTDNIAGIQSVFAIWPLPSETVLEYNIFNYYKIISLYIYNKQKYL